MKNTKTRGKKTQSKKSTSDKQKARKRIPRGAQKEPPLLSAILNKMFVEVEMHFLVSRMGISKGLHRFSAATPLRASAKGGAT